MRRKRRGGRILKPEDRASTYVRRLTVFVTLLLLAPAGLIALAPPASAWSPPGFIGFITHDDKFFVEFGYVNFGVFNPVYNGSQIYSASLELNISSIVNYNDTAVIRLYSYNDGRYLENTSAYVVGFGVTTIDLPLPYQHTYTEFLLTVDGTPAFFWAESPYPFLGISQLLAGGVDLAVFIALGLFLLYSLPLMVKAERMTKRAIYCKRSNATMWLHGIFFGLLAWYAINFPSVNSFFKGWEFVFIPFPEALFFFFWNAGRHSTTQEAMFIQVVPRLGQRMGVILKFWFYGQDADGDLVICRRGVLQWWYRSRGHHTKVFRRSETNAMEPFPFSALEQQRISSEQVKDPARFPRGAKYGAHDDFPVINFQDDEDSDISRVYFVPRLSAFKITWPHATMHREVVVPAHYDGTGAFHPETTQQKWCLPYIKDGRADIELWGWHFQDVLAQAAGYMTAEDNAREIEDLSMQLASERGNREKLSREKAESRMAADADLRNRPYTDLPEPDLDAYQSVARKNRKALPDDRGGAPA